jgi:NO-binding membrane sensor protein with MHYT domain/nitrogen-specific signal transduction histidine kinase
MDHQHHHNTLLVYLSVFIAILSSYIALDLTNALAMARGRARWVWLTGGALAMGIGIWSMHFVAMLAFSIPSIPIAYDVPLLILSIIVAVGASALTLVIVSRNKISIKTYIFGSLTMGAAIAGMHYIGIASMRLGADIMWDMAYVYASIFIAVAASFVALLLAFKLRNDDSKRGFIYRIAGAVIMGFAISGMHYTAMFGMHFIPSEKEIIQNDQLLATGGLAAAVIIGTIVILFIALVGSMIDRALSRRIAISEALEDTVKSRDEFLTIVSHELKTPLTSMKFQLELIMRTFFSSKNLEEDHKNKLQRLLSQTDNSITRINRLVDDMLDISRISTGKLELQLEEFNLNEVVKEVVERLSPLLGRIEFKKMEELRVCWDKFRIEQVLTNLLTNAGKYGEGKPIEVSVMKSKGNALIVIKDYGRGIAPENQQKIFQRFERISADDQIKGLGIGLFIVNEIVQMHKGRIEVKSELGLGAEFSIIIPL